MRNSFKENASVGKLKNVSVNSQLYQFLSANYCLGPPRQRRQTMPLSIGNLMSLGALQSGHNLNHKYLQGAVI